MLALINVPQFEDGPAISPVVRGHRRITDAAGDNRSPAIRGKLDRRCIGPIHGERQVARLLATVRRPRDKLVCVEFRSFECDKSRPACVGTDDEAISFGVPFDESELLQHISSRQFDEPLRVVLPSWELRDDFRITAASFG